MSEDKLLTYFLTFLISGMIVMGLGTSTNIYYMGFSISQGWVLMGVLYLLISGIILISGLYQGLKR